MRWNFSACRTRRSRSNAATKSSFLRVKRTLRDFFLPVAVWEQAGIGHGIGGVSVSDLEQSGTAFADVGFGIVVAVIE
jgi:hypothetical protein